MSDPFGIIGLIGVAAQIIEIGVQFGLDWKDAPADIRGFNTELQALKTALSELNTNIILNQDFRDAFTGKSSAILSQLEPGQQTDTSRMLSACRTALETLLVDLKKRAQGHRIGWERLKAAFMAAKTRDAVGDLSRRCQMLNNLVTMDTLALGIRIHKEVIEGRQEQRELHHSQTQLGLAIRGGMDHLNDQQAENKRKSILEWLTPVNYGLQQSDFINRREPGTGEWLLQSEEYQSWLAGSQKTLFCPGIPGAGKTILTSIIIDDLSRRLHGTTDVGIAYIYCNYRRQGEETATQLLANLLKQLSNARNSLPDTVISLYDRHKTQGTRPTHEDIMSALLSVVTLYSKVYIIVDALDECRVSENGRAKLLTEIAKYQASQKVNLFTTTRIVPEIKLEMEEKFKGIISLEIYATKGDVQRYLEGHTSQLPRCATRDPMLREEIKTVISDSVNGMFLLAQLFLDSLKAKKSPKAVRTALANLPTGSDAYDKAYTDAMERICRQPPEEEELAKQVLMWIICAKRPLKIHELEHAIATEPGGRQFDEQNLCPVDDMISVSAGLVTIDKKSRVVRLVHYTTQQYFQRTQKGWFPQAETFITTTCMTYLSFDDCFNNNDFLEDDENYPLYYYASTYWGIHARETLSFDDDSLDFLKSMKKAELSIQSLGDRFPLTHPADNPRFGFGMMRKERQSMINCRQITGLHLVAYFGVSKLCHHLIGKIHVDARDDKGNTPLRYAIQRENLCVAEELLNLGADPNLASSITTYETPLWIAVDEGYEDAVRLILCSTQVDVKLNMPLRKAALAGHEGIVQLLLNSDRTDGDVEDGTDVRTPLSIAAQENHLAIVKIMTASRNVNVDARDKYRRTALSYAAESGRQEIVQFLLDCGADMNLRCDLGLTPLVYAVAGGHNIVARLLFSQNTSADWSRDADILMLIAAKTGDIFFVEAALQKGANINFKDNDGRTAISYAAANGFEAVSRLLLGSGADILIEDPLGRTALSFALDVGKPADSCIRIILEHGLILNSSDREYNGQLLLTSCRCGTQELFQHYLAYNNADFNVKDYDGMTALCWAVKNGDEKAVQLLLDIKEVDVNLRDKVGKTPLCHAYGRQKPHRKICHLLRQHGATI